MTRRVLLGGLFLLVAALSAGGCAAGPRAARARLWAASPAVQAHDLLRDEVVLGRADGLARKGGCAICRY